MLYKAANHYTTLYTNPFVIFFPSFFMSITATQNLVLEIPPVCYTCKSSIHDLPYRFLIVKDRYTKQKFLPFHYFFPCWDVNYVCQNLEDNEIFKAGFCCDATVLKNPKLVNNLRKNDDLWDL